MNLKKTDFNKLEQSLAEQETEQENETQSIVDSFASPQKKQERKTERLFIMITPTDKAKLATLAQLGKTTISGIISQQLEQYFADNAELMHSDLFKSLLELNRKSERK